MRFLHLQGETINPNATLINLPVRSLAGYLPRIESSYRVNSDCHCLIVEVPYNGPNAIAMVVDRPSGACLGRDPPNSI